MDFSQNEFDEILKVFSNEADEIIQRLNENLSMLEQYPNNPDLALSIFRDAHSLKGAARMVGFNNIQTIAHKFEDVLSAVNEEQIVLNDGIFRVLYQTVDFLSEIIHNSVLEKREFYTEGIVSTINILENIISKNEKPEISPTDLINEMKDIPVKQDDLASSFFDTINVDFIQKEIASELNNLGYLNKYTEFLHSFNATNDEIILKIKNNMEKIVNFAQEHFIQLDNETLDILDKSVDVCTSEDLVNDKELILQRLDVIHQILELNFTQNSLSQNPYDTGQIKTLRVDVAKLDKLLAQINELKIQKIKNKRFLSELKIINTDLKDWQFKSKKISSYLGGPINKAEIKELISKNEMVLQNVVDNISHLIENIKETEVKSSYLIDDLVDMSKNLRVLPIATMFHLFSRMVRDIALEKGKQINLEIIGSDTRVDKNIIEDLKTPIVHIIRNAIDHGIETPQRREELGKSPEGKIILKATHLDNTVIIEIIDDGSGLNIEKIKNKALHSGFLTKDELENMTEEDIFNVIFYPGFSTGEEITSLSGRGIGLDIVKSKIAHLNGTVNVYSEANRGCCIKIEIPVSMATINALVVRSAGQYFAIPLSSIITLKWFDTLSEQEKNQNCLIFNDNIADIFDLDNILSLKKDFSSQKHNVILVVQAENKIVGLKVDKVIDEREIIQRKLDFPLIGTPNISGITTLLSGDTCFILDMEDIVKNLELKSLPQTQSNQIICQPFNYKILIVDDSNTILIMLKNVLESFGYTVETAINPIFAFEKMQTENFNLIISDIEMPEMNGFEFLKQIKEDENYSSIPVIIFTSLRGNEDINYAMTLGAELYLIKENFNKVEFLNSIRNILENNQ